LDEALADGVQPNNLVFRDAMTAEVLTKVDLGAAFRAHYGTVFRHPPQRSARHPGPRGDGGGAPTCAPELRRPTVTTPSSPPPTEAPIRPMWPWAWTG
jgi:hypothetical protein